jgi:hypothetical protein
LISWTILNRNFGRRSAFSGLIVGEIGFLTAAPRTATLLVERDAVVWSMVAPCPAGRPVALTRARTPVLIAQLNADSRLASARASLARKSRRP